MLWVDAHVILSALAGDAVSLNLIDGVAFGLHDIAVVFVPICSMSVLAIDQLLARAQTPVLYLALLLVLTDVLLYERMLSSTLILLSFCRGSATPLAVILDCVVRITKLLYSAAALQCTLL